MGPNIVSKARPWYLKKVLIFVRGLACNCEPVYGKFYQPAVDRAIDLVGLASSTSQQQIARHCIDEVSTPRECDITAAVSLALVISYHGGSISPVI